MAGPFVDGVIDTINNAINPGVFPLSFGSSIVPEMRLDYYINNYDSWNDKFVYIPTPHCVSDYQTVTLVID
jgi:hypothetical protein